MTAPEFEEPEAAALDAPLSGFSTHPLPVCFPMRIDWDNALRPRSTLNAHQAWLLGQDVDTRAEHPAPEHVGAWESWSPHSESLPSAVAALAARADAHGWAVEHRYCRGTAIHASQGRPLGLVESVALRMRAEHTARQVRVVYESKAGRAEWEGKSVWVMGPDLPPFGALGVTALADFLADPGKDAAWFAQKAAAVAEKAAAAKARNKARPKKAKEDTAR